MKNTMLALFSVLMIQNALAHRVHYEDFDTDLLDDVSVNCVTESEEVDSLVKKFHKNESDKNAKSLKDSRAKLDQCMARAETDLHKHDEVKVSSF